MDRRDFVKKGTGAVALATGLRLDNGVDALAGGNSGQAIIPGKSADSKLIRVVAGLGRGLIVPLKDLKQRGLLQDTLVIWGGVKPGIVYGATYA